MKLGPKFINSSSEPEIEAKQLETHLKNIYNSNSVLDISSPTYEKQYDKYKAQVNSIIEYIVRKLPVTEAAAAANVRKLKKHFYSSISTGDSRKIQGYIKNTLEDISYRIKDGKLPQSFLNSLKSAEFSQCMAGAYTNLENVRSTFDDPIYYLKYNLISNIATEFLKKNKMLDRENDGYEVHNVNELIYVVTDKYNIKAPDDIHARYETLEKLKKKSIYNGLDFKNHFIFPTHLDNLLNSRKGIYLLVDAMTQDILGDLPDASKTNTADAFAILQGVLPKAGIKPDDLMLIDETYEKFSYQKNHETIIKVGIMQKFLSDNLIAGYEPINIADEPIIQTSNGWFLKNQLDNDGVRTDIKVLDTSSFSNKEIEKRYIEDIIHEILSKQNYTSQKDFNTKCNEIPAVQSINLFNICNNKNPPTIDVVTAILDKFPDAIKVKDDKGQTALHIATGQGHADVVTAILDKFPDALNAADKNGRTAFHYAAEKGHSDVVTAILYKFPDAIKVKDDKGQTALHIATGQGHADVVTAILDKFPDALNAIDNYRLTALHYAASKGHAEVVNAILDKFKDAINIKTRQGRTPLHLACYHHKFHCVTTLLEKGADINMKDNSGRTPEDHVNLKEKKQPNEVINSAAKTDIINALKKQEQVRFDGTKLKQFGERLGLRNLPDLGILSTISTKIDQSKTIRFTKNLLNRRVSNHNPQGR